MGVCDRVMVPRLGLCNCYGYVYVCFGVLRQQQGRGTETEELKKKKKIENGLCGRRVVAWLCVCGGPVFE